jgi:hypothetical protein
VYHSASTLTLFSQAHVQDGTPKARKGRRKKNWVGGEKNGEKLIEKVKEPALAAEQVMHHPS